MDQQYQVIAQALKTARGGQPFEQPHHSAEWLVAESLKNAPGFNRREFLEAVGFQGRTIEHGGV